MKKNNQKNKNWEIKKFEDCIEKVVYPKKILKKNFLPEGKYPVISQESDYINGHYSDEENLFKITKPIVVFGDHTKVLKYIDFDFVLGADGVKILDPKDFLNSLYFFYYLNSINLKDLGYARHYKLLKEQKISFPKSLAEQKRIVGILDEAFENINKAKTIAKQNLKNIEELFESELHNIFLNNGDGWETKKLGDVCDVFNGSTPLKSRKDYWENGNINWFTIKDIRKQGRFIKETEQLITEKAFEETSITLLPRETVLLCCTASVGEYAIAEIELTTNQQFNGLVINDRESILPLFLYYFSSTLKDQLLDKSGKTTIDFVSMKKLKEIEISFPKSLSDQQKIVERLDRLKEKVDESAAILSSKIAALDELKKSLLQKAFNGEL